MPENVDAGINYSRRCQDGDPEQWIFQIHLSGGKVNDVRGQRLRKPTRSEKSSAGCVDYDSRQSADEERLPGVTLKGNIDNHDEGKIDIRKRRPNNAQRKLQHDGNG